MNYTDLNKEQLIVGNCVKTLNQRTLKKVLIFLLNVELIDTASSEALIWTAK